MGFKGINGLKHCKNAKSLLKLTIMRKVNKDTIANTRQAKIVNALHVSGMPYHKIADLLSVNASTVWRIERGKIKSTCAEISDRLDDLAHEYRLTRHL